MNYQLSIHLLLLFSFRILFYNCENLMYSQGHTYEKLTNLTRVIVAAGEGEPPAVIGLAEVEGDSIMRRWTQRTPLAKWHYDYIVSSSSDERGIRVAMMYQKSEFRLIGHQSVAVPLPEGIRRTRDLLHAWGRIPNGDTLDVIVCHLPSRYSGKKSTDVARHLAHLRLKSLMDSICLVRRNPRLIVMGDMNDYPTSKSMLADFPGYENLMLPLQKSLVKGHIDYGTHKHDGEWGFLDQFIVNPEITDTLNNVHVRCARSFVLPFMLTDDKKHLGTRPKRSRYGSKYEGGYSDHLPIILDLGYSFPKNQ